MAKFDFMSLVMKDGEEKWKNHGKTDRSEKTRLDRRNKIVKAIEGVIKQIKGGEDNPKRGWYSTKGDISRVSVRSGNKILPINGSEYHYVPRERAHDYYQGVLTAVAEGELDKSIGALFGEGEGATGVAKPKKTRAGWSPERRAAHAAAQAKKKGK